MPNYALERRIPSCEVDRELLELLQERILAIAARLTGDAFDPKRFAIQVRDHIGSQSCSSTSELATGLPGGTEKLDIGYSDFGALRIELAFALQKERCQLKVEIRGPEPRQTALGVAAELDAILANHRTNHYLFAGSPIVDGALFGLISLSVALIPTAFTSGSPRLGWSLAAFVTTVACYWWCRRLLPYTFFDTRHARRRKEMARWVLLGLLGFLLFTVGGVYLRNRIFGY